MKKKVLVRGPALSRSGYGEHTRFVLRCLRGREDVFDIYLHNVGWGQTCWMWEVSEEREWIDNIINKTAFYIEQEGQFDISLMITIPNEWEKLAPINIGVTAGIETTRVSPQWIEKSKIVDHIITISEHSKNSFLNSVYQAHNKETGEVHSDFRCTTPIDVVHYPVRDIEPANLDLELDYDFNYLVVAQIGPRKNIPNTIRWFIEEHIDQEVGLVIKCSHMNNSIFDRNETKKVIKQIVSQYHNRKCKLYFLHGSMTDEEMSALYKHPKIKALISLAHGEGFGLPIFEAVYNELPVIAPDWSGHVDFLYVPVKDKKTGKEKLKAHFAKVKYTIQPVQKEAVWNGVLEKESMWCYADQGSYKMKLREVYKDYNRFKSQAKKLNSWVRENFTSEQLSSRFCNILIDNYISDVSDQEVDKMFNEMFSS